MDSPIIIFVFGACAILALVALGGHLTIQANGARFRAGEGREGTMKGLVAVLACAFCTMLASSPAAAESPAERYAACLAQTRPEQVRALLGAQTAEGASTPYHALADNDHCFTRVFGNSQFTPEDAGVSMDVLRGRLAEQALLAHPAALAALPALPLQQKRYIRPWFAATSRAVAVDEMGACMADTDPSGITALIRTVPRSQDENAAIDALSPSLAKCLSAGTRLDASREGLRAALADALYQRLNNPALSLANTSTESRH